MKHELTEIVDFKNGIELRVFNDSGNTDFWELNTTTYRLLCVYNRRFTQS